MEYKEVVLILLKDMKGENKYREDTTTAIIDVIRNEKNDDEYVYVFIYNRLNKICTDRVGEIIDSLEEEGRI